MTGKNVISLGKWKKIPLRDVWPKEASNFTKWLAEEENLSCLGEELGIELELVESESAVGTFSTDIYAREVGTGRKVIIENQLETTDHDHLGKIITYAAGKEAEVIVWLVPTAREEHRNAIDWLNEHTDMEIGFFLIEMSLWSIDESQPALRFDIVEQPNNWAKTIRVAETLNDTAKTRLQYWQLYNDLAQTNDEFRSVFKPHKAATDHWYDLAVGSSVYHIALLIYAKDKIGIELCVPDNKEVGQFFIDNISCFESALGIIGEPYMAAKGSGIRFYKNGYDLKKNPDKWNEYVKWHMDSALKIKSVLSSLDIPL